MQLQKLTGSDFTGHHLLQLKKQALVRDGGSDSGGGSGRGAGDEHSLASMPMSPLLISFGH